MDQGKEIPAALAWFENATASVRTEVRDGAAWHVVTIDSPAFEGHRVVLDLPAGDSSHRTASRDTDRRGDPCP